MVCFIIDLECNTICPYCKNDIKEGDISFRYALGRIPSGEKLHLKYDKAKTKCLKI